MDHETCLVEDESEKLFLLAVFVFTILAIFAHLYTMESPSSQSRQEIQTNMTSLGDDGEWFQDRPVLDYSSSDDDDDDDDDDD